jgi:predicted deacylase
MKESTPINKTRIKNIFETFANSNVDGVPGIVQIESTNPGPILGITACTHGNEPSGLAVFDYLLNELDVRNSLLRGTLFLVVNNIEATESFFAAATEKEVSHARYKEVNMNRLPKNVLTLHTDKRYEIRRVHELLPIWRQFTVALDIHSTAVPTEPMIISRGDNFQLIEKLILGFPVGILISNIDGVTDTAPAFSLYGGERDDVPIFAIEAGQHTEGESFKRAVECSVSLLQNLGMFAGTPTATFSEYKEYRIEDSIIFPDISFDFISEFRTYDSIRQGQVLARGNIGREIVAPIDGHLILPTSKRGEEKDISQEAAFVSLPMQRRRVSAV